MSIDVDTPYEEQKAIYLRASYVKVAKCRTRGRLLCFFFASAFALTNNFTINFYNKFEKRFYELTKSANKKQYLVPYLMSSHPGSTMKDAIELAVFLKRNNMHPEQVQDYYPTPGTISTCMFYTGIDPNTMQKVYVPKTAKEKAEQRALLQYFKPENRQIVLSALKKANRFDLIGTGKNCLVAPDRNDKTTPQKKKKTIRNIHKKKK